MVLSSYFNRVLFLAAAGGTADFVVGQAVTGYSTPAQRGIPNGTTVTYTAQTVNLTQWETGQGIYTSNTVMRTTVRESTSSNTKVNFASAPNVFLDYQAQDIAVASVSWLNVKNFGALGNGTTDDTSAINSAITAFNAAGAGVLYFPFGNYKITSSLTTITASGLVQGDGSTMVNGTAAQASTTITYTPTNSVLFTSNSTYLTFQHINFIGSLSATVGCSALNLPNYGGFPVAASRMNVYDCVFTGFYNVVVYATGQNWFIDQCVFSNWVNWGIYANNLATLDAGGWEITNTLLSGKGSGNTAAGIRIETGGGDHIVNTNVLGCVRGIDLTSAFNTSDLLITNCSLELNTGTHINLDCSSRNWNNVVITNCEFDGSGGNTNAITAHPATSTGWLFANLSLGGTFIQFIGTPPFDVAVGLLIDAPANVLTAAIGAVVDATGGIGGNAFFELNTLFFPTKTALTWKSSNDIAWCLQATQNIRTACFRAVNLNADYVELFEDSQTGATGGYVQSNKALIVASDSGGASGGSDPVSIRAGGNGTAAEVFQAVPAGQLKMTNAANFSANSNVATSLGSIGPAGSRTTVQKWLTIQDSAGNPFYIPCF